MPKHYTSSWQFSEAQARATGQPLYYAASSRFSKIGIESGDILYIVSVNKGLLYLLGKMEVDRIIGFDEARENLSEEPFAAAEHALARSCTPTRLTRSPLEITKALRFLSNKKEEGLFFTKENVLSGQTLRVVRRLAPESALLLDSLLEEMVPYPSQGEIKSEASAEAEPSYISKAWELLESIMAQGDSETSLARLRESLHQYPNLAQLLRLALEPAEEREEAAVPVVAGPSAGRPWRKGEDSELIEGYDSGRSIQDLADDHRRSRGAIEARLVKLGKLQLE